MQRSKQFYFKSNISCYHLFQCLLDIFVKNQDVKICPINEKETEEIPTKEESIQAKSIPNGEHVGSVDDKNENTRNLKTEDLSDKENTGYETSIGLTDEESGNHGDNPTHIQQAKETKELIESMQYMVEEEINRKPVKTSSKSKSCNLL